jgi:GMP synthase-like glutamine amidotransferase
MLVIMGGPMSVNDTDLYPWLADEIAFAREAIGAGKKVFGICLGAQLIAKSLGCNVYKNPIKEIGWFVVRFEQEHHDVFPDLRKGQELFVFHWHGETFDLPEGAVHLFSTDVCKNQGFAFDINTLALQFHLEMSGSNIDAIVEKCRNELVPGERIQTGSGIARQSAIRLESSAAVLFDLLDRFTEI